MAQALSFLLTFGGFEIPAMGAGLLSWAFARASREEWKILAWVPVAPLAIWGAWIAIAVTRDPTSHNLWPFEFVFWALVSAALFACFAVGRSLAARSDKNDWAARRERKR